MAAGTHRTYGSQLAIRAAAWSFPDERVPVETLPELAALGPERRASLLGTGVRHIATGTDLGPTGLAERAARAALQDADLRAEDVGSLVVVESRAPETLLSSEATRLQDRLGADRALTFTVGGLGCVSVTPALLTARGLLATEDIGDVLIAHGSVAAAPGHRYRHPVTVNGDAGQALVCSRTGPVRVLDVLQESNGAYWDLFRVDYRDRPQKEWYEACADPRAYAFTLALETRSRLSRLLDRLLERHGMVRGDVSGFVSHNLSSGGFRFLEESLDIGLLPVCAANLARYGHLGANDVFLNLWTALRDGMLGPGQRVVLVNASPVAAWSLLLVEIGNAEATA